MSEFIHLRSAHTNVNLAEVVAVDEAFETHNLEACGLVRMRDGTKYEVNRADMQNLKALMFNRTDARGLVE